MTSSAMLTTHEPTGERVVFVDFDHTLFAANSTEMFISRCRPMLITSIIEFSLRRCLPWRRLRSPRWQSVRDYVCVISLIILMPWNLLLWRRNAARIFREHKSDSIEHTLDLIDPHRLVIISFGMTFLIRPLLKGTKFMASPLIATPGVPSAKDLFLGKRELALARIPEEDVRESIFLTDSEDDRDLLSFCRDGQLIPRQGRSDPCHHRLYLPFRYLINAKYRRGYVIDQTLFVDLPIYFLATFSPATDWILPHAGACLLLMLSQLCVYEIGYFENDMVAAGKELRPTLSARVSDYAHYPCGASAWIWSCLFYAGSLLVQSPNGEVAGPHRSSAALWFCCLLALRLSFYIYNRVDASTRMLLYPCLQFAKYFSVTFYLGFETIGPSLVLAQITTMWMNYCVYRSGGSVKRDFLEIFRSIVIVFSLTAILLSSRSLAPIVDGVSAGSRIATLWSMALVCGWCSFRLVKRPMLESVRKNSPGGRRP